MHYLVDDLHSLEAAGWPEGEYWSTSTGLPYLLPEGLRMRSPEEFVDNDLYQDFGKAVLNAHADVRRYFTELEAGDPRLIDLAQCYSGQFYSTTLCVFYKALLLDRWLKHDTSADKAVIGSPKVARPAPGFFQFGRHDHLFLALGLRMEERLSIVPVPPIDERHFFESFNFVPKFDKMWNVLNRTSSSLVYKILTRFSRSVGSDRRGTLLIGIESDPIEESFLKLVLRGWRIVKPGDSKPELVAEGEMPLSGSRQTLESLIVRHLSKFIDAAMLEAAIDLLWSRMRKALTYHPSLVDHCDTQVRNWKWTHASENRPIVYLSSGLYSSESRILDGSRRRAGIPVICVDHGIGAGLGRRHDYTATEAISFSDHYLTFNRAGAALYEENRSRERQTVTSTQAPMIMRRSKFPRLQRASARRYLGVSRNESTLIYVTNLALNNVPIGYGTSTDREYALFQGKLVDSLATFAGRVIIKPYPSHRYADPEQIWQMPLPDNMVLSPFGEFRHIRWAADVLVLDLCSSTLGWAMNTDIPLIYVDNTSNPMTDRAAEAARRSIFYISSMESNWEEALNANLRLSKTDRNSKWTEMAGARRQFNIDFVNGGDRAIPETLLDRLEEISQHRNA